MHPSTLLLLALLPAPHHAQPSPPCRDRFLAPFTPTSIWNHPIGSSAHYIPAGIYSGSPSSRTSPPVCFHNDLEYAVLATPSTPNLTWMDTSGDFPGSCSTIAKPVSTLPFPPTFTTSCDPNNAGAAVLLPDNRTLVQLQPLYRHNLTHFVAWYHTGAPIPFPWEMDILGDGALGAHGGSGLSAIGGSIRSGELSATTPPITHALKLELWAHAFYFANWTTMDPKSAYTWPATGSDSYTFNTQGAGYNGTNPYLKPGALLAVPPATSATLAPTLTTTPAAKILHALTFYGAYIVDDTGSRAGGGAFCAQDTVNAEVEAEYGYSIAISKPLTPTQGGDFYKDLVAIYQALSVVVNNGPESVGGGGVPLAPMAPPICGAT